MAEKKDICPACKGTGEREYPLGGGISFVGRCIDCNGTGVRHDALPEGR